MIQKQGRGLTGLGWFGTALLGTLVGCGGWVDLESQGGGGSSTGAAGPTTGTAGSATGTAGSAVGGSQGLPHDNDGGAVSQTGGTGAGGDPISEGGAGAVPRFVALVAPEPQHWPAGVAHADLTWSGVSQIDAGSLEEGALVGTMTYCFKVAIDGSACAFTSSEPFVWTEATGMVPLSDLESIGDPTVTSFYPTFVSADGNTVVGSFGPNAGGLAGFFRWTKDGGAASLGEPADTQSGGPSFVSKDGTIVAGVVKRSKADTSQFIWTESDGFQLLDSTLGWPANSDIVAMSEDGTTLLAETMGIEPRLLHHWTLETGAEPLGTLPDLPSCTFQPRAAADLTTVFGSCFDPTNYIDPAVGFRWTSAAGMVPLTEQSTGATCQMNVLALATDGESALGISRCGSAAEWHWAKWSATADITLLADVAPAFELTGASEDGTVIFGSPLRGINPDGRAFTWDGGPVTTELAGLATADSTWVFDSNASGTTFAGQSGEPNAPGKAVIWDNGAIVDVGDELALAGVSLGGAQLQAASRVATREGVTLVQGVANSRDLRGVWFAWLSAP